MSGGWRLKCKVCSYHNSFLLGFGYLFLTEYRDTIENAKKGEFGKELQSFLEEHPSGRIDCEKKLLHCKHCGMLATDYDLSMFLPAQQLESDSSTDDPTVFRYEKAEYVTGLELKEYYYLVQRYEHICPRCHRIMGALTTTDMCEKEELAYKNGDLMSDIPCPECNNPLQFERSIFWD